jgi:hypothetical protein
MTEELSTPSVGKQSFASCCLLCRYQFVGILLSSFLSNIINDNHDSTFHPNELCIERNNERNKPKLRANYNSLQAKKRVGLAADILLSKMSEYEQIVISPSLVKLWKQFEGTKLNAKSATESAKLFSEFGATILDCLSKRQEKDNAISDCYRPAWPGTQRKFKLDAVTSLIFLISQGVYSTHSIHQMQKALEQSGHGSAEISKSTCTVKAPFTKQAVAVNKATIDDTVSSIDFTTTNHCSDVFTSHHVFAMYDRFMVPTRPDIHFFNH